MNQVVRGTSHPGPFSTWTTPENAEGSLARWSPHAAATDVFPSFLGALSRLVAARCAAAGAVLLVATGLSGCGAGRPATVPVSGSVTLDGQPVAAATVLFQPVSGVPGRAITAADGSFTLTSFTEGDGAVVGRHHVAVSKLSLSRVAIDDAGVSGPGIAGEAKETWHTPKRYATPAESGLEIEVEEGMGPVSLELSSG